MKWISKTTYNHTQSRDESHTLSGKEKETQGLSGKLSGKKSICNAGDAG